SLRRVLCKEKSRGENSDRRCNRNERNAGHGERRRCCRHAAPAARLSNRLRRQDAHRKNADRQDAHRQDPGRGAVLSRAERVSRLPGVKGRRVSNRALSDKVKRTGLCAFAALAVVLASGAAPASASEGDKATTAVSAPSPKRSEAARETAKG